MDSEAAVVAEHVGEFPLLHLVAGVGVGIVFHRLGIGGSAQHHIAREAFHVDRCGRDHLVVSLIVGVEKLRLEFEILQEPHFKIGVHVVFRLLVAAPVETQHFHGIVDGALLLGGLEAAVVAVVIGVYAGHGFLHVLPPENADVVAVLIGMEAPCLHAHGDIIADLGLYAAAQIIFVEARVFDNAGVVEVCS